MKTFLPQTIAFGATRRIDGTTLLPIQDLKGRWLWNMPPPSKYAKHTRPLTATQCRQLTKAAQERRGITRGEDGRLVEVINVPIYRATSASMLNRFRSQYRRDARKRKEKLAGIKSLKDLKNLTMADVGGALRDAIQSPIR